MTYQPREGLGGSTGGFFGHPQGGYGRHLASDGLSFCAKFLSFLGENLVFFMLLVIKTQKNWTKILPCLRSAEFKRIFLSFFGSWVYEKVPKKNPDLFTLLFAGYFARGQHSGGSGFGPGVWYHGGVSFIPSNSQPDLPHSTVRNRLHYRSGVQSPRIPLQNDRLGNERCQDELLPRKPWVPCSNHRQLQVQYVMFLKKTSKIFS